ncbi:MAG TPA: DUF4118 domain-containing protein [Pyrinomonadaceae bacterium]|nr:DUF4118 domain-containing protein [Pyrinomonadaceae bacterium]
MGFLRLEKLNRTAKNLLSIAGIILLSAALLPFRQHLNPTEVSLALLLVVLFASSLFGSIAGLIASAIGIVCFNFFFLPPFYTFNITGSENLVAFGAFVVTALIAGQLSGYAKRRAEESEQRQSEIERLYDELKAAFEQASEAEAVRRSEQLKTALLDAVTHDLRTPLTSIKASVTTLLEDAKPAFLDGKSRQEFLEIIDEECDRLNEFIENMVGIAKIEANALSLNRKLTSVEEIVGHAIERARASIGKRSVVVEIQDDLPYIFADAASISEVVFTLLDNAAKYSPAESTIMITARSAADDHVMISVQDQGKGIPAEMRDKIFDKFFQVEEQNIHRTGGGLGLGLAIAKGIVEFHDGSIEVEDGVEGFVTKFVLALPSSDRRKAASPNEEAKA